MPSCRTLYLALALAALCSAVAPAADAQSRHAASPVSTPTPAESDAQIRVYTEEVRIPVFARDEYGHFDPTLEHDDVLVLEDGEPQTVRSVRRIPASVLLVLNTGGELNPGMRTKTTRELALALVGALRRGDRIAVLQFNRRVELLQDWTTDPEAVRQVLRTKLFGASGAHHAEALTRAARLFAEEPLGNRHVVLVTDGVETPGGDADPRDLESVLNGGELGGRASHADAFRRLQATGATIHVVSYAALGRKSAEEKKKAGPAGPPAGSVAASGVSHAGIDPTRPPTQNNGSVYDSSRGGFRLELDPAMRRVRKAYERAEHRAEQQLKTLTAETGGLISLPFTDADLVAQGAEVAREIGTQYVVTYTPKRPLASSPASEYRRIQVVARRGGLTLRARRGYVAAAMQDKPAKFPEEQE